MQHLENHWPIAVTLIAIALALTGAVVAGVWLVLS
jgi:hypothetical protein